MAGLINFDHVAAALALDSFDAAAARQRMAPVPRGWQQRDTPPTPAAVLILIFADARQRLQLVLTLRNAGLRGHSGQVSFPGGRQDPEDANLTCTALRETEEEIGIGREDLRIMGALACLYIPTSHFDVLPLVARCAALPEFAPNPAEVAHVFCFGLDELLQPRYKRVERRQIGGIDVRVPYYAVQRHKVWGATAIMLSELEGRLRSVLPRDMLHGKVAANA